jgi:hypothetical protein
MKFLETVADVLELGPADCRFGGAQSQMREPRASRCRTRRPSRVGWSPEDATTRPPAPALDGDRQAILDWLGLN